MLDLNTDNQQTQIALQNDDQTLTYSLACNPPPKKNKIKDAFFPPIPKNTPQYLKNLNFVIYVWFGANSKYKKQETCPDTIKFYITNMQI